MYWTGSALTDPPRPPPIWASGCDAGGWMLTCLHCSLLYQCVQMITMANVILCWVSWLSHHYYIISILLYYVSIIMILLLHHVIMITNTMSSSLSLHTPACSGSLNTDTYHCLSLSLSLTHTHTHTHKPCLAWPNLYLRTLIVSSHVWLQLLYVAVCTLCLSYLSSVSLWLCLPLSPIIKKHFLTIASKELLITNYTIG